MTNYSYNSLITKLEDLTYFFKDEHPIKHDIYRLQFKYNNWGVQIYWSWELFSGYAKIVYSVSRDGLFVRTVVTPEEVADIIFS